MAEPTATGRSALQGVAVGVAVVVWHSAMIGLAAILSGASFGDLRSDGVFTLAPFLLSAVGATTYVWARQRGPPALWPASLAIGLTLFAGLVLPIFVPSEVTVSDDWGKALLAAPVVLLGLVVLPIALGAFAAAAGFAAGRRKAPMDRRSGLRVVVAAVAFAVVPGLLFGSGAVDAGDGALAGGFFAWLGAYGAALGACILLSRRAHGRPAAAVSTA